MKLNSRFSYLLVLTGLTSALFACSSSSGGTGAGGASNSGGTGSNTTSHGGTANGSGGTSSGTGTGTHGGTTGSSGGTTGSHGGTTSNGGAANSTSGGSAACDPSAMGMDNCPDYTACVENACSAEYEQCMGAGYKQGDFTGGACADWLDCTTACNCDQACAQACTQSAACTSCLTGTIGNCVLGSNCLGLALACSGNGAGGSGSGGAGNGGAGNGAGGDLGLGGTGGIDLAKTCADLQACCDAKTGDAKTTCDGVVSAAQGQDVFCAAAYAGLACP